MLTLLFIQIYFSLHFAHASCLNACIDMNHFANSFIVHPCAQHCKISRRETPPADLILVSSSFPQEAKTCCSNLLLFFFRRAIQKFCKYRLNILILFPILLDQWVLGLFKGSFLLISNRMISQKESSINHLKSVVNVQEPAVIRQSVTSKEKINKTPNRGLNKNQVDLRDLYINEDEGNLNCLMRQKTVGRWV